MKTALRLGKKAAGPVAFGCLIVVLGATIIGARLNGPASLEQLEALKNAQSEGLIKDAELRSILDDGIVSSKEYLSISGTIHTRRKNSNIKKLKNSLE